jgi:hypothetical protein
MLFVLAQFFRLGCVGNNLECGEGEVQELTDYVFFCREDLDQV